MPKQQNLLIITSAAFTDGGMMPVQYTGRGKDVSPPFTLAGLMPEAKTIAIIMDDLDIPFIRAYTHWVIWNIPAEAEIPGSIPHGESVPGQQGAMQGIGYGQHCYRGPKPPAFIRHPHRYVFRFYALDCSLTLESTTRKKDLLRAMQGHILQEGSITGLFVNPPRG